MVWRQQKNIIIFIFVCIHKISVLIKVFLKKLFFCKIVMLIKWVGSSLFRSFTVQPKLTFFIVSLLCIIQNYFAANLFMFALTNDATVEGK